MILRILKLTNFRNITGDFNFTKGLNVVVAPNGVGKTNLLEALNFISSGKSFRTSSDVPLIRFDLENFDSMSAFSRLEARIIDALGNETTLEAFLEKTDNSNGVGCKKILKVNGNRTSRKNFSRIFYSVIFSPNTLDLVSGSPSLRRRDLDDFLSLLDEEYMEEIYEYKKVIRNRNKLLEKCSEGKVSKKELNFWNDKLVDFGSSIIYKRGKFFKRIAPILDRLAPRIFNLDDVSLCVEYICKFDEKLQLRDIKISLKDKLAENMSKEIRAGVSLYGPHREDFRFFLQGKVLDEYGSRGQQRLCAFLYKIAQWHMLKDRFSIAPILLLDDLFSELDDEIHGKVQKLLLDIEGQIVLSALKKEGMEKRFLKNANEISL